MRRLALPLAPTSLAPATALLLLLAGCPGELEDPDRFTDPNGGACADVDVPALLEGSCGTSACHAGPDQNAPVDLISPGVADRLLDVPAMGADGCTPTDRLLVDTSDVDASYLLEKIDGSTPECGDPMPILAAALTPDEVACVEAWVRDLVDGDGPPDAGL